MKLNILQLGKFDWRNSYQVPTALNWQFNDLGLLKDPKTRLQLVVISEPILMPKENWELLRERTDPYNVVYTENLQTDDPDLKAFLQKNGCSSTDHADSRVH